MSAEIIQFIPRANPSRVLSDLDHMAGTVIVAAVADNFLVPGVFGANPFPADCGNIGWPWPEDKA